MTPSDPISPETESEQLIERLLSASSDSDVEIEPHTVQSMPAVFIPHYTEAVLQYAEALSGGKAAEKISLWFSLFAQRLVAQDHRELSGILSTESVSRLGDLYHKHIESDVICGAILRVLSTQSSENAGKTFVQLIIEHPPSGQRDATSSFLGWFQRTDYNPAILFPELFDALHHPSVAGCILDLANYVTRHDMTEVHPARDRAEQIGTLLGSLVQQLHRLEESIPSDPKQFAESQSRLAQGTALIVSLCDAVGLMGEESLIGKLNQALELGHRRLQIEAASALARLKQENGIERLVQLAGEPVVRNRALAYLEELEMLQRVSEEDQTPQAKAQGEVAQWLAAPTQLGLAPQKLDLCDTRTLPWPGFEEPVTCYLFRYTYRLAGKEVIGIAIAGPLVHAFTANMSQLSPYDIYSAFVGWSAVHEEIDEQEIQEPSERLGAGREKEFAHLQSQGFDHLELVIEATFFGEKILVAKATRNNQNGTVILQGDQYHWYSGTSQELPPSMVYSMFKGKRLLKAFGV